MRSPPASVSRNRQNDSLGHPQKKLKPNPQMKPSISLLTSALLLSASLVFSAASSNDIAGNWQGTLRVGEAKLRLLFKITSAPGGAFTAKLDSLDQGARDIPIDTVTMKEHKLRMEVKKIQAVVTATRRLPNRNLWRILQRAS